MSAEREGGACPQRSKPWVLTATILGSSMAFIDSSVVNIALPAIQRDLDASVVALQWVLNAYTLLLGALILTGGAAGDRFGRRRVFLLGIALFTFASVACGLAPDSRTLILARGAQGIGGALLVPSSLAIISATFDERERGRAIGTWAGFAALTTALGPVLGGWLVDNLSWRAVFFINVPVAVVTLAIAGRHMPETRDGRAHQRMLDWPGALLATAGLGLLTYGLIALSEREMGTAVALPALISGATLIAAFLWVEARLPEPMMPLGLFRSRTFSGANLATVLLYFSLGGALFFLPFNLIQVQGYSATAAGAAFLPFTLMMGGLSRWSGGLVERYGARKPLIIGPLVAGVGFALMAVPDIDASFWTTFLPAMLVLGFGMAIAVAPLTTIVMGAVGDDEAGVASGINNAAARIAGLFAVAVLGAVAIGVYAASLEARLVAIDAPPAIEQAVLDAREDLAATSMPEAATPQDAADVREAINHAFVSSFRTVMLIAAALAFLAALAAGMMIEDPERKEEMCPRRPENGPGE